MFADVKTIQDLNFEGFPQADFHHGMSWPLFIESKKRGICFAKVDGIDMGLSSGTWRTSMELSGTAVSSFGVVLHCARWKRRSEAFNEPQSNLRRPTIFTDVQGFTRCIQVLSHRNKHGVDAAIVFWKCFQSQVLWKKTDSDRLDWEIDPYPFF